MWNSGRNFIDLLGQRPVIKRFARDLLACGTLYQSCQLRCSCVGFFPSRRVAGLQTAFLPANSKLVCIKSLDICIHFYSYCRIATNENNMK